jgi:hypothetical protein
MSQAKQTLAHEDFRLVEGVSLVQGLELQLGRIRGPPGRRRILGQRWSQQRRQQQAGGKTFHFPLPPINPPLGELGVAA